MHCVTRIDLHAAAAADNRHAPAFCENGQIFPKIDVREQFYDHVNTAPGGRLHDLDKVVGRAMIEHFVRPLFARELASFVTARRAEHAETASARQLHRSRSDAAARTVNQHCFARLSVGALEQPAICRRIRRAHGCALCERNIHRQRMHLLGSAQRKLGIRATDRARDVNTIARLKLIHICADLLDHSRAVVAGRVG